MSVKLGCPLSMPHHFAVTAAEPDTTPDHRENQRIPSVVRLEFVM
jgi:hypothetical protein